MKARTRRLLVTLLALTLPGASRAESSPGNALNPSGGDTTRITDERGMSHLRVPRSRTPSGFLYPYPLVPDRLSEIGGSGWRYRGSVEFGGLWSAGDDDERRFVEYADWKDAAFLEFFSLALARPESGVYMDVNGGSVGRDDQYFYGAVGVGGLVRLRGSFSGIPHVFAADATNLYEGEGSDSLRLPSPLVPGGNSDSEIAAALASVGESRLQQQRDRTHFSLDFRPLEQLSLFARYTFDDRDGERPFGGALMFDSGGEPARVVETTEPRDHRTHNFSAGASYRSAFLLGNLEYNGSLFRNRNETLTWDNPFSLGLSSGAEYVERGRFDLAPDNDWHNVKGDVGIVLPLGGRLTATASWSRMSQDDDLIPPTVNSGVVGVPGLNAVDLDLWNSPSALSRGRADARVDTLLLNARLHLRPWRPLRLAAGVRYYDQHNDTRYTAFNPDTDQIGYVAEDGAHNVLTPFSRVFVPGAGTDDYRYRSSPYDYRKLAYEFSADYGFPGGTTLGARYRREEIDRDERERGETGESQVRVILTSRGFSWATLRASYEYRNRDGDAYDPFPNRDDHVSSLEGFVPFLGFLPPFTLAQLRKYDIADRERHAASLNLNVLPREDLDLAISARFVNEAYGADYGLTEERSGNVHLELDYQPSPLGQTYVFAFLERRERELGSINDTFAFSSDPNAGGAAFPFENAWQLDTRETSWGVGAGCRFDLLRRLILELDYSFIVSEEAYEFDIAGPGALGTGLTTADDLPDLRTRNHLLQTSLRFALFERVALRLFYRYERSTISDFSQRNLDPTQVLFDSGALFLGHVDRAFDAHVSGVTLQIRL